MARKKSEKKAKETASADMSERSRKGYKEATPEIRALMNAREGAERDGHVAGMVEAAAIAMQKSEEVIPSPHGGVLRPMAADACDAILAELRRRYKNHPELIERHMKLRGLA